MDAAEYFKKLPLFAELNAQEVMDVLRVARLVQFEAGEYLCRMNEPGDGMFVIEQGVVSVRSVDESGQMVEIAKLGEGEVIGELALVDGQPRSADVLALTALKAYRIDRSGFDEMRAQLHPAVLKMLKHIATTVSWRLREINTAIATAMTAGHDKHVQTADSRLSKELSPLGLSQLGGQSPAKPQERGSGFWRDLVNRISLVSGK